MQTLKIRPKVLNIFLFIRDEPHDLAAHDELNLVAFAGTPAGRQAERPVSR
jgi:hypothetical protein